MLGQNGWLPEHANSLALSPKRIGVHNGMADTQPNISIIYTPVPVQCAPRTRNISTPGAY